MPEDFREPIPKSTERTLDVVDVEGLVRGSLSANEFLDSLFSRDQESAERNAAAENLIILTDPRVVNFFAETHDEVMRQRYHSLMSLTHFHIGQQEARENLTSAAAHLDEAAFAAFNAGHDDANEEWARYVRATRAYIAGDANLLANILDTMDDVDKNTPIVKALLKGLRDRGRPDYGSDYSPVVR